MPSPPVEMEIWVVIVPLNSQCKLQSLPLVEWLLWTAYRTALAGCMNIADNGQTEHTIVTYVAVAG